MEYKKASMIPGGNTEGIEHKHVIASFKDNTLKTICTKKLMRDKKRYIFELLAKEGISMTNAYTLYKNIDYEQRELIENHFGLRETIVNRNKQNVAVTGLEKYFEISFYIHRNKTIDGFMSITRGNNITKSDDYNRGEVMEEYLKFVEEVMLIFKGLIRSMKKLDGLMICTINRYIYIDDSKEIDINMLDMLDKMIKIYLEFKYEDVFIPLIVCKGTNRLIYSSEYKFKGGTRYVEIEEKNYKSFIKEMSMVDE